MDYNPIYIMYATIIVIIIVLIDHLFFRKEAIITRKLKNKKGLKVSEVQNGNYITFKGKVVAGTSLLKAKLSNRSCVCYSVQLQEYSTENSYWSTASEQNIYQQFFLDVDGAYIMIVPNLMLYDANESYFSMENQKSPEKLDGLPFSFKYTLKEYEEDGYDWKANKKKYLRFREGIIEVGEIVVVKGIAQWKTINEEIEGYSGSKILTLTGTKKHKLIITGITKVVNKTN
ncbi:hypothetical protein KORDIASMS9_00793 [Kordia sp. SMS9]|uniref:hypothetical protein n=1 Tax=Kordia sp. SMS9 TaxID=2282170 RepID=UPI000E0D324A|nr:hypothetical protein [Kordia sp. SMS9]AXG68578.1 hypothetical protein KORDIASMS9_00793 [Kordia sp. SMS9]